MMGIATMMTACADNDLAAWNNPLGDKIYGLWYADYQESGIVGVDKTPYSRVVQAVKFNADGTGTWWKMMFAADDASKPLALFGGRYLENGSTIAWLPTAPSRQCAGARKGWTEVR